jgi:hypothetical protein
MLLGEAIFIVGAVFLSRLGVESQNSEWIPIVIFASIGMGTAQQLPYTALQLVLKWAFLFQHV